MSKIIVPLATSGIMAGMLLTFITAMRELSLIILLVTPSTQVLAGLIFGFNDQDQTQHAAAATLVLVLIVIAVNIVVRRVFGAASLMGLRQT